MARLFVKSKGQLIQDLLLNEGKSYIAGRRTDADIVLPSDKGISREHFKIYFEDGAWNLKVLSHYGKVFSSGVLIELTHLEQGQKFQVESFEFEFVAHENSIALANESPGRSVSVPMQLPDENEKTYIRPSVLQVPFLKILNSLGEVRELIKLEESGPWVSGREGQLPIIISDSRVSRRQFEITFRNNNYYIQDLGSSNGTFINEVMISNVEAHQLQSGDVIRVLENEMIFELRDPQFEKMARSNELSIVNSGPMMPQSMMSPQPMMSPDQMMIPSSPWSEIPMEPMGAPPETPMDKFKNLDPKKRMIYVVSAVAIIAIALFGDFNGKKELPPEVESGKTPFE
ncbi:MAG TPA: FHA domain-containing protein, partial [Pseudobdellovibrionaceae bacterium]|nr:FHA domain-containing protein [Pseudobdellovibrionaceae bacterium]